VQQPERRAVEHGAQVHARPARLRIVEEGRGTPISVSSATP
jgi:hypothetical protein